jgi:hypothetical protein
MWTDNKVQELYCPSTYIGLVEKQMHIVKCNKVKDCVGNKVMVHRLRNSVRIVTIHNSVLGDTVISPYILNLQGDTVISPYMLNLQSLCIP